MMFRTRVAFTCLSGLAIVSACGSEALYTAMKPAPTRPAKSPSAIQFYAEGEPPNCKPFVTGLVRGYNSAAGLGPDSTLERIRELAAAMGADGVLDFHCAAPGTVGAERGKCQGKVYFCQ